MKKLLISVIVTLALVACGGDTVDAVESAAQTQFEVDGVDATIATVVEGDPTAFGTAELYCVETDATNPNTQLPYLVAVYGAEGDYETVTMAEGFYEWDLYGCPRPGE